MNFVGFSAIHVSQNSVATYVRYGITALYSKFSAVSVSERIFKIGYDLTKLLPKSGGFLFLGTRCIEALMVALSASPDVHYFALSFTGIYLHVRV